MSRRSTRSSKKASGGDGEATSSKATTKHESKGKGKAKAKVEDDDDTFQQDVPQLDDPVSSEYEEPVTGQRRRKRTENAPKPTKRSRWTKAIPSGAGKKMSTLAGQDTMASLGIEDLAVSLDDSTTVLNHFQTLCEVRKLHAIAPPNYTPNLDEATHVLELPFYEPDTRHYELIEDGVLLLQDYEMFDGGLSNVWRVQARNIQQPEEDVVNLFTMHTTVVSRSRCPPCREESNSGICDATENSACTRCTKRKDPAECIRRNKLIRDHGINFITDKVCDESERQLVIELGRIKVDIMNRTPMPLDINEWKTVEVKAGRRAPPAVRLFIDHVSLITWKQKFKPSFDLNTLGYDLWGERKSLWVSHLLGGGTAIDKSDTSAIRRTVPAVWAFGKKEGINDNINIKIIVPFKGIDIERVNEIEDLTTYHVYTIDERDSEDEAEGAAFKAVEYIMFQLAGLVGTVRAFRDIVQDHRKAFLAVDEQEHTGGMVTRGQNGPYNGGLLWIRPSSQIGKHTIDIILATGPMKDLVMEDEVGNEQPVINHQLSLHTAIRDRVCLAYIMQESLNALARGDGLLKVIFSAFVAAQYLELGILTKKDVLEQYCTCVDAKMRAVTEHLCTICYRTRTCAKLAARATAEGVVLECGGCTSRSVSANIFSHSRDVEKVIRHSAIAIHVNDSKYAGPEVSWTPNMLSDYLVENFASTDDTTAWEDGYCNLTRHTSTAIFPAEWNVDIRLARKHPHTMSIEKPYRRMLRPDGAMTLHDVNNVILTTLCVNMMKTNSMPSSLPLLKMALSLKRQVSDRPPLAGYHPEVTESWKILERAFDHQRMIERLSPGNVQSSLDIVPTKSSYLKVQEMNKSGIWDGKTVPTRTALRATFQTRGEASSLRSYDKFQMTWTKKEWMQLLEVISQVEEDRSDNGFNKHGLTLPRLGPDKVPWLWRVDTCPDDVDIQYIFREYRARLHTMDTMCDAAHETIESPATLYVENVVQWFETGGKCHIFGFTMTAYCGHLTNFSIGRGVTQQLEGGGTRLIKPGELMASGCKVLLPKDIHKDYDITRRTIIFESWKANALRFCWPVSPGLIDMLEQVILDIADSTKWFNKVGKLKEYCVIPLPMIYKDKTAWVDTIVKGVVPGAGKVEMIDSGDVEDDGDEELFVRDALLHEVQAAKEGADDERISTKSVLKTHEAIDEWRAQGEQFMAALDPAAAANMAKWLEIGTTSLRMSVNNSS